MKARKETVTTPPPEELEHVVTTPPSHHGEDPSTDYLQEDNPVAPFDSKDGSVVPPTNKSRPTPPDDPFSRF